MQLQKPIFVQQLFLNSIKTHYLHSSYFALHYTVVVAAQHFFQSLCYFMFDGAEVFCFLGDLNFQLN
jgi:hypothetical protein